jgi:hypothetical protein
MKARHPNRWSTSMRLSDMFRSASVLALFALTALGAAPALAQSGTVYVKTNEAEIRNGTQVSSPVVAKVPRGTALPVLEDGRLRVRVRAPSGAEGYVARTMVQNEPVAGSRTALGGFVVEDRGPSEMRTAASGRGLMEATEEMAARENLDPALVQSVRRMEQLAAAISESAVDAFIRQGGL